MDTTGIETISNLDLKVRLAVLDAIIAEGDPRIHNPGGVLEQRAALADERRRRFNIPDATVQVKTLDIRVYKVPRS